MYATELIRELRDLVDEHGEDLEVYREGALEGAALEEPEWITYHRAVGQLSDGTPTVTGPAVVLQKARTVPVTRTSAKRHQGPCWSQGPNDWCGCYCP